MGQGLALSIKERRKELGLTQVALASAAEVSLRTLKAWEAGEASPSLVAASRLAAALGISLDDLADPAST